jgi:hypothetical protein
VQAGLTQMLIFQTLQQARHDFVESKQVLSVLDEESLKDVYVSFG